MRAMNFKRIENRDSVAKARRATRRHRRRVACRFRPGRDGPRRSGGTHDSAPGRGSRTSQPRADRRTRCRRGRRERPTRVLEVGADTVQRIRREGHRGLPPADRFNLHARSQGERHHPRVREEATGRYVSTGALPRRQLVAGLVAEAHERYGSNTDGETLHGVSGAGARAPRAVRHLRREHERRPCTRSETPRSSSRS